MQRFRQIFDKIPYWVPSFITVALICWLTLAPRPLGDVEVPLFPGADKIAHGVMFGFLVIILLIDICRARKWGSISLPVVSVVALGCAAFGVGIEFIQQHMQAGRSLEAWDMVADVTGAITCAALWLVIQPALIKIKDDL